jgi:hypothetical protein
MSPFVWRDKDTLTCMAVFRAHKLAKSIGRLFAPLATTRGPEWPIGQREQRVGPATITEAQFKSSCRQDKRDTQLVAREALVRL